MWWGGARGGLCLKRVSHSNLVPFDYFGADPQRTHPDLGKIQMGKVELAAEGRQLRFPERN
jgi:hypothetical protein